MAKKTLTAIWITALFITACSPGAEPPAQNAPTNQNQAADLEEYQLEIQILPTGSGSVFPNGGSFREGAAVQVKAAAADGYIFDRWTGDHRGDSPNLSFIIDADTQLTAHFTRPPTITVFVPTRTPRASLTPEPTQPSCASPADVSADDQGNLVEVCGEVTNWGNVPCPDCALGGYSFVKLEGEFLIISYDWMFNDKWIGLCISAADQVEMLGAEPVFIFGKGEGYAGSECSTGTDGSMSCQSGEYFQQYYGCD